MLTIQSLKDWGANTQEGLTRCMNNETFYLMLIKKVQQDTSLTKLLAALDAHDLDAAFEAAHALKGILANLALTPALIPVSELTELLRARREMDYSDLAARTKAEMDALMALIAQP